jgi:hypothetical protein
MRRNVEGWKVDTTVSRNQSRDRYAARKRGIAKDGIANGTGKVDFIPWVSVAVMKKGVSGEDSLWIAK